MKNLLLGLIAFCFVLGLTNSVMAGGKLDTHKYISTNMANNDTSYNDTGDMYSQDLNRVELYLYHKIYPRQSLSNRLGRIERTIFRQTYPSMTYSERVNNILSCYQDTYNMKNYVTDYYSPNPFRRIYSRYNGYPTGLTPPITPPLFNNAMLPGYHNAYYGNRGYRYNNMIQPTMGAGVRILE